MKKTEVAASDPIFADPRLAAIYDHFDPERDDLGLYMGIVKELGAHSVLDIGCGTGAFASLLASEGLHVVGVDPAEASLSVARSKRSADRVQWIRGDATSLPDLEVDLATMTGNVAQVFLADEDWMSTLSGIRSALSPSGHLVFEARDPAQRAWEHWNRDDSYSKFDIAGKSVVESWVSVLDVSLPYVSFRWSFQFESAGAFLTSGLDFEVPREGRDPCIASEFWLRSKRSPRSARSAWKRVRVRCLP